MTKQITTGTKITFKETSEKFILTQTETGFDAKQMKFSKSVQPEHWTFQEFMNEYENGNIIVDGFEEGDAGLIHSILTNYIYQANLKVQIAANEQLKTENEQLKTRIAELEEENKVLAEADKEEIED